MPSKTVTAPAVDAFPVSGPTKEVAVTLPDPSLLNVDPSDEMEFIPVTLLLLSIKTDES
jgi:hypothetical protein